MTARYREQVQIVGEIQKVDRTYIGEVCRRCDHASPDRLNPPNLATAASYAHIFVEGREPMIVDITTMRVEMHRTTSWPSAVEFKVDSPMSA